MRVLYLDEAGIGSVNNDPHLVVAGVLVRADTQWVPLANRLRELTVEFTPVGSKAPSCLHAKDIFHGSREFPRDQWDADRRFKLLKAIGSLPEEFDLPVVWSSIDREEFARDHPQDSLAEHLTDCYSTAAIVCLAQTEIYLRRQKGPVEVASVILEQNNEIQRRIPELVSFLREPGDAISQLNPGWEKFIPPRHLIDTPAVQSKSASSILQLADYIAFAVKRKVQKAPRSQVLTEPFARKILMIREAGGDRKSAIWNPMMMSNDQPTGLHFKGGKFNWRSK